MRHAQSATDLVMVTTGCHVALFDRAIVPGQGAAESSMGPQKHWLGLQNLERLAVWMTLFWGVYKVEVIVVPDQPRRQFRKEENLEFLGGTASPHFLECPTGELIVADAFTLDVDSLRPVITVKPGRYELGLVVVADTAHDLFQEAITSEIRKELNSVEPDWTLFLQRTQVRASNNRGP